MKSLGWTTSVSTACRKVHDSHARYTFVQDDCKGGSATKKLLVDCDHFVAAAAMVEAFPIFTSLLIDLLAENERITATAFDVRDLCPAHAGFKR